VKVQPLTIIGKIARRGIFGIPVLPSVSAKIGWSLAVRAASLAP
jgi:hypothetical protein